MSIKKILVPLDGTEISLKKLPTALLLAQRFNAHIEVLCIRPDPNESMPFVFGSLASTKLRDTVLEAAQQGVSEQIKHMRQQFDEFCQQHSIPLLEKAQPSDTVSASWHEADEEQLIQHCHLADIITVVRTPQDVQPLLLESILLKTGRPVILAPPQPVAALGNHIAIGWNDSAEVVQAVASALPLMHQAQTVTIISAPKRSSSAEKLIEYLAWHGLSANLQIFKPSGRSVGAALLKEANAINADLLVIGAYSHTRARQLLFGGVTQHFIAHADLPIFMAH